MFHLLAPFPHDRSARRGAQLLAGLVLYGVTAAMLVLARLGLDPWDALHQGLSRTFGLGIGTWAIIVSFVVLLGWCPLRQRPGIGTVVNVLLVGAVIDLVLAIAHPPHVLWARIALLVGGVAGNGLATGFYIGAGLGPVSQHAVTRCASFEPASRQRCWPPASCSAVQSASGPSYTRWRSGRSRTGRSRHWRSARSPRYSFAPRGSLSPAQIPVRK